jgi:hypothetical protein
MKTLPQPHRILALLTAALTATIAACAAQPPEGLEPMRRGVTVAFGERNFEDDDDYDGVDDPSVLELGFDTYQLRGDLGWEVAVAHAKDDHSRNPSGRIEIETSELSGGIRRTWRPYEVGLEGIYPYVAGGASLLYSDLDIRDGGGDEDDFDVGLYLHFGLYAEFFSRIRWGLDYRIMREDFIDGGGLNVDYNQYTMTLGYSF